jgi:hypothetical protein
MALADRLNYSHEHVSDVELARSPASEAFVAAVDEALDARGRLIALYPAVVIEQVVKRYAPARRSMT